MIDTTIDEQTLRLIIELQLEDIKNINGSSKGKHRAGEHPDPFIATRIYEDELKLLEQCTADAAMCKSIADAVLKDGDAILAFELNEQQARNDRQAALRVQNEQDGRISALHHVPSRKNSTQSTLAHVDKELLEKMLSLNVRDELGESSQWAASRQLETKQCDICTDHYAGYLVIKLHCGHEYCKFCISKLYTDCLTDESLFPPRCCRQPILVDSAKGLLGPKLVGSFKAREAELATTDRTYCYQPACSNFISSQFIVADRAICPNCQAATCVTCKAASHQDQDCPQDKDSQDFAIFAQQEGWQRCYSCHRFVELRHGCNHISECDLPSSLLSISFSPNLNASACRCQAEFCYDCGARWKTCGCVHFREDRLVARADVLLGRNPQAINVTGQQRDHMRRQEMQNLLQNHECDHRRWQYRRGEHQCEECYHWLPDYIFECRQCRVQACNRCRRNRL